jgi:hypothetical protein
MDAKNEPSVIAIVRARKRQDRHAFTDAAALIV